jgi:Ni/Co efflux regulator RcnB
MTNSKQLLSPPPVGQASSQNTLTTILWLGLLAALASVAAPITSAAPTRRTPVAPHKHHSAKGRHKRHSATDKHKHDSAKGRHKRPHRHHNVNGKHKRPQHRASPPVLRVSGTALKWDRIDKVRRYTLATIRHPRTTRNTSYQTVTGTSFTPPVWAGQTVSYGLEANVSDAPWAKEVTITYPAAGPVAPPAPVLTMSSDVLHWTAIAGVRSYTLATILNPDTTRDTTYQTVTGTSFRPPTVSGRTVNYGLEANVAGGGAPWATEATINWPGTTPLATTSMRVGVNSLIQHDYIANLTSLVEGAGVTSDRIDVGTGSSLSLVTSAISKGLQPLVLYNPPSGLTPATYAAQVQSLATRLVSRV